MSHSDEEKLHASVLVAPAKERRRYRKQRRQAADQLHREQRQHHDDDAAMAVHPTLAEELVTMRRPTRHIGVKIAENPVGSA